MSEPDGRAFDELDDLKDRVKRLKGSLARNLLRSISFRLRPVFPTATRVHVILYPDNVYRIWAVTVRNRWLAVCEDNVAPTWTSINLDHDVDLLLRLGWSPRIHTYIREDGIEVHSVQLETKGAREKRLSRGRTEARHVDEGEAPPAQDGRPPQEHGWPFV